MDNRMTVGTHRSEVADRVHSVARANGGERCQVMDMDKARKRRSIHRGKVEAADDALRTIVLDALPPRPRVALVSVNADRNHAAFGERCVGENLLRRTYGGPGRIGHNADIVRNDRDARLGDAHVLADAEVGALAEVFLGLEEDITIAIKEGSGEPPEGMVPVAIMDVKGMCCTDAPLFI